MTQVTLSQVLKVLSKVHLPDATRDVVSLGWVKNLVIEGSRVSFDIELPQSPTSEVRSQIEQKARDAVLTLQGVQTVSPRLTLKIMTLQDKTKETLVPGITHIVPVASGKGGVGKSTVSANLAVSLTQKGYKVGLMDADVFGPSIPSILGVKDRPKQEQKQIIPVEQYGIKIISTAFFMAQDQAAIMRGPMLHKMVEQFFSSVKWGNLDYLIIDLPPGTGDVQLSLCQIVPLTGAVIVSTPQDIAMRVAEKAIIMFQKLNCPILGMVENMSHFVCGHCNETEHIFGSGGVREAAKRLQMPFLGEIPLATQIRIASSQGRPLVLQDPQSALAKSYNSLADNLVSAVQKRQVEAKI